MAKEKEKTTKTTPSSGKIKIAFPPAGTHRITITIP
jgi:hypothetical protein